MEPWMPFMLAIFSVISTLLMLFMGLFLRGIKTDLSKNTDATVASAQQVSTFHTEVTRNLHALELTLIRGYTPIDQHNDLRRRVHDTVNTMAEVKGAVDLFKAIHGNSNNPSKAQGQL